MNPSYTEGIDVSEIVERTFTVYNALRQLTDDEKIHEIKKAIQKIYTQFIWSTVLVGDIPDSMSFHKRIILDIKCQYTLGIYGLQC